MKRMTAEQKTLLKNRIGDLYGWIAAQDAAKRVNLKETPEIKKARALVAKFDKANQERRDAVEQAYADARRVANEAIAFKDPPDAYAYVMALKPIKGARK